jgi:hypothetical protein
MILEDPDQRPSSEMLKHFLNNSQILHTINDDFARGNLGLSLQVTMATFRPQFKEGTEAYFNGLLPREGQIDEPHDNFRLRTLNTMLVLDDERDLKGPYIPMMLDTGSQMNVISLQ